MVQHLTILWSAPALDDLDEIAAWIASENPPAAAELVRRTLGVVERLAAHPASGRRVPGLESTGYREVICPPCRIIYRREKATVLIVHVVHTERILDPARLF